MVRGGVALFQGTERFELVAELGSGAMGTVFKVLDRETDSYAALKLLETRSHEALRRFKREFRSIQGIQHPNLVSLGELEETDGAWFFTMELVEGRDFLSYCAPKGVLDEQRLRHATEQLALGLLALHRADKIHRDVKPSNVLITEDDRLILLDFGLVLDASNPEEVTGQGEVVGTGAYMAPELIGGGAIGASVDCYALGVMLYEALTGELPFSGTVIEIMMKKREHAPRSPRQLRPDTPEDLERLCLSLLEVDPALRPTPEDVLRVLGAADAVAGDDRAPPFVGRDRELDDLLAWLAAPRHGRSIVVQGTSGVGKTALVRRFVQLAREREDELVVLTGRCYERESVPFKGIDGVVEALARYLSELPPHEVEELLPENAALMARVFPVLDRVESVRDLARSSPGELAPTELRRRAFVALRRVLARIAAERPLVIRVDDVQWANRDSWALLDQLTQPPAPPAMLLIVTRRPTTAKLQKLPGDVRQVDLGPLPPEEAHELAAELLRRAGRRDHARAAAIAREAEGHPLFVYQLAQHVIEGGEASGARLEDALRGQVARLSAPARELLALVATAGAPLPHQCMARAAQCDFAEYQRLVKELSAANFARTQGPRPSDTVVHYHDRIRLAVLERMSEERRKRMHLRLANAVEETGLADIAPEVAVHHLAAAGLEERAAFRAETAARRAAEILAFDQAAALFWTALQLGAYTDNERRRLALSLAETLVNAGRGIDAAELFLEVADASQGAERLDCRRRAADQLLLSGHIEDGIAVLSAVLADIGEALPATPKHALSSLLWQRAALRLRGLRGSPKDLSETTPRELVRLDTYQTVAVGLTLVDNIRGADYQARFLRMALRVGEPLRVMRALSFEAALQAAQGSRRRAILLTRVLERWSEQHEHPLGQAFLQLANAGRAIYLDNDWPATMKATELAGHILRNNAQSGGWETDTARLFKCFALLHMGKLDHLARLVPVYVREAERRGDRYSSVSTRARLIMPWLTADDPDGGSADLEEAMQAWAPWQQRFSVQHFFALHSRCELDVYRGDPAAAVAHLDEQLDALRRSLLLRLWMPRGEVDHLRGRIALAAGDGATAQRFARTLARNKLPAPRAWGLLLRAGAAQADGKGEVARGFLERACAALEPGSNDLYRNAARVALGDPEGARWLREEGVANPTRLCALLVPGFDYDALLSAAD